jgi:hypothetical protein
MVDLGISALEPQLLPRMGHRMMKQFLGRGNAQLQKLQLAFGGATLIAVLTMFLPVAWLEGVVGSTGISEMIPAMGAPLGDTARALIAFTSGIVAFALIAVLLLKNSTTNSAGAAKTDDRDPMSYTETEAHHAAYDPDPRESGRSVLARLRDMASAMIARARGSNDSDAINDLADLPKLRNRDIHPDAPARAPISALRDFGAPNAAVETAEANVHVPSHVEPPVQQPLDRQPVVTMADVAAAELAEAPAIATMEAGSDTFASLESAVSRLEAALERRQVELDRLEDIAQRAIASSAKREIDRAPAEAIAMDAAPDLPRAEVVACESQLTGPVERRLEVVEHTGASISRPRSGDDALRSALETLHRMNARAGS